ncbi:MAG: CDP-alcohol phosphatidyltransferase family protein [Acidimicrobiales bacterium]
MTTPGERPTSSALSFMGPLTVRDLATVPNLITFVRLLMIPVFVWLLFGRDDRGGAAWLLAALGSTDWVDGWFARRFAQVSEFGKLFDPLVDRLMFLVAIPCLLIDGSVPIVVAVLALAREGIVALAALVLAKAGVPRFDVTWEGKTGAFLLMFAFPLFLGSNSELSYADWLGPLAWLFAVPGLGYSYYSVLFQYLPMTRAGWLRAHSDTMR